MSTLYNFKTLEHKVWVSADGRQTPYNQLEGSHLLSIIEEVKRRKEQNVKRILNKVSTHTEEDLKFVQLLEALEQEKIDRINGWNVVQKATAVETPTNFNLIRELDNLLNRTYHTEPMKGCRKCILTEAYYKINDDIF